jgi:transcription initiation factor IIE alpha subunit
VAIKVIKVEELEFTCPKCGKQDTLGMKTSGVNIYEKIRISIIDGDVSIEELDREEYGDSLLCKQEFYCEYCGELISGVDSPEKMAAWIREENKKNRQ